MAFTSAWFAVFLALVAVLYRVAPRSWRCPLLVAASYCFYWLCSQWFALLLFAATLLTFFAAKARSLVLVVAGLLFAVLVFFKSLPLLHVSWPIPLGISYYTFKLAGYLIDTHWGAMEPERRLMPFLAYSSFFPQIVAGPIQRPESFLPQVELAEPATVSRMVAGMMRIALGLFKKFAIADNLGLLVDFVYGHLHARTGTPVLLGFYGFPLQMYADFSGLTDIAIGAAALFGIDSPENFNAPFSAAGPSGYWRRWHMTLTLWLTDYVFTPLRMSLRNFGNAGLVFSLFANMLLIGLWHGFRWTYVVFGAVHAFYLSVDALTQKARKRWYKRDELAERMADWTGPIITFNLVAVAFVFFRAGTLADAVALFHSLFDAWNSWAGYRPLLWLTPACMVMAGADSLMHRLWAKDIMAGVPRWGHWCVYGCTAVAVSLMVIFLFSGGHKSSPFLYAVF